MFQINDDPSVNLNHGFVPTTQLRHFCTTSQCHCNALKQINPFNIIRGKPLLLWHSVFAKQLTMTRNLVPLKLLRCVQNVLARTEPRFVWFTWSWFAIETSQCLEENEWDCPSLATWWELCFSPHGNWNTDKTCHGAALCSIARIMSVTGGQFWTGKEWWQSCVLVRKYSKDTMACRWNG